MNVWWQHCRQLNKDESEAGRLVRFHFYFIHFISAFHLRFYHTFIVSLLHPEIVSMCCFSREWQQIRTFYQSNLAVVPRCRLIIWWVMSCKLQHITGLQIYLGGYSFVCITLPKSTLVFEKTCSATPNTYKSRIKNVPV